RSQVFFFQAEDGIRDFHVTGVQTCALPISGKHGVLLRHDGINRGAGGFMTFEINPGDIQIFWVGVTGNGWGVLTVDNFDSDSEARDCVEGAEYSVKPATQ